MQAMTHFRRRVDPAIMGVPRGPWGVLDGLNNREPVFIQQRFQMEVLAQSHSVKVISYIETQSPPHVGTWTLRDENPASCKQEPLEQCST